MIKIIYSLFIIFSIQLNAQQSSDSLYLNVNVLFDGNPLQLDSNYISKTKDTLSFSTVKFYLSSVEFHFSDNSTYKEVKSYHLIDVTKPKSTALSFSKTNFKDKTLKSVQFNIGVDSLMSVSGAMKDDLDPTKGMYWAWQSGYINMKIEGKSSSCLTRKNKFQFHIGGYIYPNYAIRKVIVPSINQKDNNKIALAMDLGKLFSKIQLKENNTIMIPGKDAMQLADLSSQIFFMQ